MCVISRPLRDSDILRNYGGKNRNSLNNILASDEIDTDIDLSSKSPYVKEGLSDYLKKYKDNVSFLSLNTQSINAKYDKLKVTLEHLSHEKNINFTNMCFQESWLKSDPDKNNEVDTSNFELNGYKSFAAGATCSLHGGVISYVKESLEVEIKLKFGSKYWDGIFLHIKGKGTKPFILGNIYRSPKMIIDQYKVFFRNLRQLCIHFAKIIRILSFAEILIWI